MHRIFLLSVSAALALAACGEPASDAEGADDYASRIGANGQPAAGVGATPSGTPTPAATATPLAGAAPGLYSPGTATDPQSAGCGAPRVAPYFERRADATVRAEVTRALAPQTNIRFVAAGTAVETDVRSRRLNIMLDDAGIIRDARCG